MKRAKYKSQRIKFQRNPLLLVVVMLTMIMLVGGGLYSAQNMSFAYMSLDTVHSIELHVNIYSHIVSVKGLDADAQDFLDELHLINLHIEDGMNLLTHKLVTDEFSQDRVHHIVFAIYSPSQRHRSQLYYAYKSIVTRWIEKGEMNVNVVLQQVNRQTLSNARSVGVTVAKYNLINTYIDQDGQQSVVNLYSSPLDEVMRVLGFDVDRPDVDPESTVPPDHTYETISPKVTPSVTPEETPPKDTVDEKEQTSEATTTAPDETDTISSATPSDNNE